MIVWIASPPDSGIAFIDSAHPDRPRHHILIKFGRTPESPPRQLNASLEYTVTSRANAGSHSLWIDIYAALASTNGKIIRDMGIASLPVVVDTHIGTKLLMLMVIISAVFLFIVEWGRVDVVAIAMMVLLPELGLLNAQDTFKGPSSNAVIAIIGVMIISYGLNRAGLVSRMIQPLMEH